MCIYLTGGLNFNREAHKYKYMTSRLMFYFWIYEKPLVFPLLSLRIQSKIHYIVTFKNILKAGNKEYKLSGVTFH